MSDIHIILLTDVREMQKRKRKELAYYLKRKEELETKLGFIRRELKLTDDLIKMIEKEKP